MYVVTFLADLGPVYLNKITSLCTTVEDAKLIPDQINNVLGLFDVCVTECIRIWVIPTFCMSFEHITVCMRCMLKVHTSSLRNKLFFVFSVF